MPEYRVHSDLSGGLFFIDGQRQSVKGERPFDVIEPRSGKIVMQCDCASAQTVDSVVKAAAEAQRKWSKLAPLERGKILQRAADIIRVSGRVFGANICRFSL